MGDAQDLDQGFICLSLRSILMGDLGPTHRLAQKRNLDADDIYRGKQTAGSNMI
jgi:hypothetical protein